MADVQNSQEAIIKPPGDGAVTTMLWSPNGAWLAFGTDEDFAGLLPVAG